MPNELCTEVHDTVQEKGIKTIPKQQKYKKAKRLSKEALQESVRKKAKSLSRVRLFATPWTVAYQAPLSIRFSRQEYWSVLPFSSPGDLPDPGIEPRSPALEADALTSVKRREAKSKGEKKRYTHLNAEIQRIASRDKKTFLSDQCKEIEGNNRMKRTEISSRKSEQELKKLSAEKLLLNYAKTLGFLAPRIQSGARDKAWSLRAFV